MNRFCYHHVSSFKRCVYLLCLRRVFFLIKSPVIYVCSSCLSPVTHLDFAWGLLVFGDSSRFFYVADSLCRCYCWHFQSHIYLLCRFPLIILIGCSNSQSDKISCCDTLLPPISVTTRLEVTSEKPFDKPTKLWLKKLCRKKNWEFIWDGRFVKCALYWFLSFLQTFKNSLKRLGVHLEQFIKSLNFGRLCHWNSNVT